MNSTAPNTTRTVTPANLRRDAWFPTLRAAGIASSHELWVSESGDSAVYLETVEGGPVAAVHRWAASEQELPAWSFGHVWADNEKRLEAQEAAENWVLATARNEVRAEMDLPLHTVEVI